MAEWFKVGQRTPKNGEWCVLQGYLEGRPGKVHGLGYFKPGGWVCDLSSRFHNRNVLPTQGIMTKGEGKATPEAIAEAIERFNAMGPKDRAGMDKAQRENFIQAMTTPCEHGALDWETCSDCRAEFGSSVDRHG